ncbi:uncharacterized protein LOC110883094 [Helianthus annuus]|uniref:uncharacterized protein LOC110883094 n=1 Tax=Helianthus annuus TaxID=4232 RepID=UPI000B8FAB60|nr:uncharacterized protein LOC110883094 [Helianthus annuus]
MGILSSARSSVLVNGSPTFEFQCGKGMRQGDPISPFLFIVTMEALSYIFDKACEARVMDDIRLPNYGPLLSHLLYADDAIILGEWSRGNVENVVRILRSFYVCSGLRINLALLAKWGWRFKTEKENLWVKVISAIHTGGSKWDFFPVKKTTGGGWQNIISVINKPGAENLPIRNFFKGVIGKGEDISFWLDPWLTDQPLKMCYPNLFQLEVVKNCSVKNRLERQGLWLWRSDPNTEEDLSEMGNLRNKLLDISLSNRSNSWRWLGTDLGLSLLVPLRN